MRFGRTSITNTEVSLLLKSDSSSKELTELPGNEAEYEWSEERILKNRVFETYSRQQVEQQRDGINLETSSWPYEHEGWLTRPRAIDRRWLSLPVVTTLFHSPRITSVFLRQWSSPGLAICIRDKPLLMPPIFLSLIKWMPSPSPLESHSGRISKKKEAREREGSWREEKGGFIKVRESWDTGQG